jgi:hypothetical protein
MLPASEGDSLILSYGPQETDLSHLVVDGGRASTWPHLQQALEDIAARGERVELLLLSHIDADHIDGLLKLAEANNPPLTPNAVWYNAYKQLEALSGALQPQGYRAADAYSEALEARGWALNQEFGGDAITVEDRSNPFNFAGLRLTLVSPTRPKLLRLWAGWQQWRDGQGLLQPMGKRKMPQTLDVESLSKPSPNDTTAPNGSSIALIAEYGGRKVLLGADAHPDVLEATVAALAGGSKLALDLVKLPHHGSRANVTAALLELIDCSRFAFSTSGAVFGHPDPEAVSRVLKFSGSQEKTLYFNYRSERTTPWDDTQLKAQWNYTCVFPAQEDASLVIDI